MKNLNKIQITFKDGYGKRFIEEYEKYVDPTTVPENTMNRISEDVFEFLPWPEMNVYQKYEVIDFLNTFGFYEGEHFEVTEEETIAFEKDVTCKSEGNVWCPISGGNNEPEYQEKMEAQFGKNWRDLFNGL